MVHTKDMSLELALQELGWRREYYERINRLGDLLSAAKCVSEGQLKAGFEVSFSTGLPLLRVLVLRQALAATTAQAALTAQVLLRDRIVDFEQAVSLVRQSRFDPDVCGRLHIEKSVTLGQVLVHAGAASEIDVISAAEMSLLSEQPIGRVLVENGAVSEQVLERALALQTKLNSRTVSWPEAEDCLKGSQSSMSASSNGSPLDDLELSHLMQAAGIPKEADLPSLLPSLRELVSQKQNLALKIVSQHEEIRTNLARELHDTAIADLMMLKRYMSGDRQLSPAEVLDIVDDVVRQLRNICYDSLPRQLQDVGLKESLKDLLERMAARTHMQCSLICETELPELKQAVNLHVFRIAQECLTNAEKYANAKEIVLAIHRNGDKLRFEITDDGKGFDQRDSGRFTPVGGMGMGSIQERRDLIREFYPAELRIESKPGHGSRVSLELTVPE
jgi:signal transduction histidine kinase